MSQSDDPTIPSGGRIDLHAHLVPGLDDGCRMMAEALECVHQLKELGFVGAVCTPHFCCDPYPENTPITAARAVLNLQDELEQVGLEFHLWVGGELRINERSLAWVKRVGVPTLGAGHCVLLDFWGQEWGPFADQLIDWLNAQGYRPILAHPERISLEEDDLLRLLDSLDERGVWLQGNLSCLSESETSETGRLAHRLLSEQRYYVLATDVHRPRHLEASQEGLRRAEAEVGSALLARMLEARPRQLLAGDLD